MIIVEPNPVAEALSPYLKNYRCLFMKAYIKALWKESNDPILVTVDGMDFSYNLFNDEDRRFVFKKYGIREV